jgi:hypothetical protein
MLSRPFIPLLLAALFATTCHSGSRWYSFSVNGPKPTPSPAPPVVVAYNQFSPGDALEVVQRQLGLNNDEVRYRSGMPDGQMGMVYFVEGGNLHVDAKKSGGAWVILSVPLLEPSSVPVAERVAEWDRAADAQRIRSGSDR